MRSRTLLLVLSLFTILGFASTVLAVDISGTIAGPDGKGIYGATIKAWNPARKMAKSVFSDKAGRYTIRDLFPESHSIRVRMMGYEEIVREDQPLSQRSGAMDFTLKSTTDIMGQLSGADFLENLPKDRMGRAFRQGCVVCHQIGTKGTRTFRSETNGFGPPNGKGPIDEKAEWMAVIAKMRSMDIYSVIPKFNDAELAEWMVAQGFGKTPKVPKSHSLK